MLRISRTTTITRRSLKNTGLGLLTISATLGCSPQSTPQAERSRPEPTPVIAKANANHTVEATSAKPRDYTVPTPSDTAATSPSKPSLSEPQTFGLDQGASVASEPSPGATSIAASASDTVRNESSGFELNLAPASPSTLTLEPPVTNVVPAEPAPANNNVLRSPVSQESPDQVTIDTKREKVKIRFDADASPLNGRIKAETASHGPTNNATDSSDPNNQELAVNDKRLPFTKLPEDDKQTTKPSSIVVASAEEKNQKIAVDWPKPKVAFFITGQQYGYLEPCGCTGLANQKGGLNRRDTLLTSILERGWDVLPLDAGNQVRRKGRQAEMKFQSTADAFKTMNYAAVSLGTDDLFLSPMQLFYALINFDSPDSSPFVSSNITIFDESAMKRYKTIRVGNMKIGITAVLGDEYQKKLIEVKNKDLQIRPAVESLRAVAAEMAKEKHDYQILLAHATLEESAKYAKEVPGFRLVVTAGGFGEPEDKPSPIEGTQSVLVQCGVKGMYAGLFALYDDAKTPVRYQRIALSSQFEDSPRMLQQFVKYQDALKQVGLQELGSRPLLHSSGREFVGLKNVAIAIPKPSIFGNRPVTPNRPSL